jgi:hypothetical protein
LKRSFATLIGLALLAAPLPVIAIASCAAADTQVRLAGFESDVEGAQIYIAVEGRSPAAGTFTAERRGLSCVDQLDSRVEYELVPGTASPPQISVVGGSEGTLRLGAPPRSGGGDDDWRATKNFNVASPAPNDVQHATIRLHNQTTAGMDQVSLGFPREAPVFVLDGGSTSINFGLDAYNRQESFVLDVPVFRSGPAESAASFNFEITESGTDHAEPQDYEVLTPGPLQFGENERVELIKIEMKKDTLNESAEQFTIRLQGAGVGNSASVDVTIDSLSPGEAELRPTGRLHHPKHKYKYPQNYPWLNEIHLFTASADRELRVRRAEMSIVKKLKSNACRWWNGSRFVKQRCIDRRWFDEGIKNPAKDYFLHRLKQRLPVSVGKKSNVAYYEIRARWWDNENHVSTLRVGANKNRFDVIKPTKACRDHPFDFRKCKPVRP